MKAGSLVPWCCPECRIPLKAEKTGAVDSVLLLCPSCSAVFPVREGVPRFAGDFDSRTQRNFGQSWHFFHNIYENQSADFIDWLHPVQQDFFAGKLVLDAGAGTGMHALFASSFGAREVQAIDLSSAVEVAFHKTRSAGNVQVSQADIYRPPFAPESFDYIYSIGVLQHLPDHAAALKSLWSLLKKGGHLSVWVYGREGTLFVRLFIEPLRYFFRLLPPRLAYALAWPPAMLFFLATKSAALLGKVPFLRRIMPMADYLVYMAGFPFKYQHNSVYDQLIAPRSYFFRRAELEKMFAELGARETTISNRNGMSWRVLAAKPL